MYNVPKYNGPQASWTSIPFSRFPSTSAPHLSSTLTPNNIEAKCLLSSSQSSCSPQLGKLVQDKPMLGTVSLSMDGVSLHLKYCIQNVTKTSWQRNYGAWLGETKRKVGKNKICQLINPLSQTFWPSHNDGFLYAPIAKEVQISSTYLLDQNTKRKPHLMREWRFTQLRFPVSQNCKARMEMEKYTEWKTLGVHGYPI